MAKRVRILSIDGGGMRGVIATEILAAIEEHLQHSSRNPEARLTDYFDLFAGTSTGGILTCLYLCPDPANPKRPRYSARQVAGMYAEVGPQIFNLDWWQNIRSMGGLTDERYAHTPLENFLNKFLADVKLSELIKPCLIPAYDIHRRHAFFYTQHTARRSKAKDFLARDVARATSAAPTFFEVANIKSLSRIDYAMIDGGVFASNPAMCAYAEAYRFQSRPTARRMMLLSMGAGQTAQAYAYVKAKHWGLLEWAKPLFDIFMSGNAETVDQQIMQIFTSEGVRDQYMRFDPHLDEQVSPDMDNATPANLRQLRQVAVREIQTRQVELDCFVEQLVRVKEGICPEPM